MRWLVPSSVESGRRAVFDAAAERWWTYGDLEDEVRQLAAELSTPWKALVFCRCENDTRSLTAYLASMEQGQATVLLDASLPQALWSDLVARYRPDLVIGTPLGVDDGHDAVRVCRIGNLDVEVRRYAVEQRPISPELALLLPTSGSTGSPKLVRLTRANILSNARSICQALSIGGDECAAVNLPLHYSYGLSQVNTHLATGAAIVLTKDMLTSAAYWQTIRSTACTSMAGVPYSYQLLKRLDLDQLDVPSVRTMTQAGGRLKPDLALHFHDVMDRRGGSFFVMYGQTEATARITVMPHERLAEKAGSVGRAIPGGRLWVDADGSNDRGEVLYEGSNVMLGYAETEEDLALGDTNGGVLRTGDVGRVDEDGFLYLTGRLKRIAKILGHRINLDELEALSSREGPAAVISIGDKAVVVFCEGRDESSLAALKRELVLMLRIHHSALDLRGIEALPRLPSGKVDYTALNGLL